VVGVAVAVGVAGLDEQDGEGIDVEIRGAGGGEGAVGGGGSPSWGWQGPRRGLLRHRDAFFRIAALRPVRDSRFGLRPLFVFHRCDTAGLPTDVTAGRLHPRDVALDCVQAGAGAALLAAALLAADQAEFGKPV
jgi:hypothetical protein